MKTTLLTALLACAGLAAHAQNPTAAIKSLLTSKTWKINYCLINGFKPAEFTQANNIKNVDVYREGDRYIFRNDGTYTLISTQGGGGNGVWDVQGQTVILNPGSAGGGTHFDIAKADATYWHGRTVRRLGLCNVTSLYEVSWTPAQVQ
ncbi:MAG: hypothetical protein ACRYFZ_00835 [Janthinobacterium lividum]